ncbi:hypothetical protein [Pseudomonas weihenstephanensis]
MRRTHWMQAVAPGSTACWWPRICV